MVAAFDYLNTRPEIDPAHIGPLGISQAGWVMPLAVTPREDISLPDQHLWTGRVSGRETIDQTRNEMTMAGMPAERVELIVGLLKLQDDVRADGTGLG